MEGRSRKHLIRGAFLRLMINNMLLLIAVCVCGLIDNLFIGRTLGKDALAAVGFFSPVTVAIGFCYVVILGAQVLTGNLVGEGKIEKVNRLFMSAFITLTAVFSLFSVRVRDNCREFDPRKRMELFDPEHPEKNIGIRIVTKAANKVDYYNNVGINTLIMKF